MMSEVEIKTALMLYEAKRWIGIHEVGGNNKGQLVELFQKSVDGKAQGEAWCMCLVQHCVKKADEMYEAAFGENKNPSKIFHAEHCLTVLAKTPKELIVSSPQKGAIVIWQHGDTSNGHTGLVLEAFANVMQTVEGNTGPDDKSVVREGDGVYQKLRSIAGSNDMKIKGYILPWGKNG